MLKLPTQAGQAHFSETPAAVRPTTHAVAPTARPARSSRPRTRAPAIGSSSIARNPPKNRLPSELDSTRLDSGRVESFPLLRPDRSRPCLPFPSSCRSTTVPASSTGPSRRYTPRPCPTGNCWRSMTGRPTTRPPGSTPAPPPTPRPRLPPSREPRSFRRPQHGPGGAGGTRRLPGLR